MKSPLESLANGQIPQAAELGVHRNFSWLRDDEGGETGDSETGHDRFDFRIGNTGDVKFNKIEFLQQ